MKGSHFLADERQRYRAGRVVPVIVADVAYFVSDVVELATENDAVLSGVIAWLSVSTVRWPTYGTGGWFYLKLVHSDTMNFHIIIIINLFLHSALSVLSSKHFT